MLAVRRRGGQSTKGFPRSGTLVCCLAMVRSARVIAGLVVLVPLALAAPGARADDGRVAAARLARAKKLYDAVSYAKALRAYKHALAARDISPQQKFEALLGEGYCLVVLGRSREASTAFDKALTLNPVYRPPPSLSPKLASAVTAARAKLHMTAPTLSVHPGAAGPPPTISISAADPSALVHRIEVEVRLPGKTLAPVTPTSAGSVKWTVALAGAAGKTVGVVVRAYDIEGFEVARLGTDTAPASVTVPAAPKATPKPPKVAAKTPPHATKPPPKAVTPPVQTASSQGGSAYGPLAWTTAGLGVAALGAGIYFGLQSNAAAARYDQKPSHYTSQDAALADARLAQQDGSLATGLYVGTGVLAAASGLFFYIAHAHSAPATESTDFAIAPVRGGAMLMAVGRFP